MQLIRAVFGNDDSPCFSDAHMPSPYGQDVKLMYDSAKKNANLTWETCIVTTLQLIIAEIWGLLASQRHTCTDPLNSKAKPTKHMEFVPFLNNQSAVR